MSSQVSELILRLKEDVTGKAKGVASALQSIEAAEKRIGKPGALGAFTKQIGDLDKALKKVGEAREAQRRVTELAAANEKARGRMRALASEILAAKGPTDKLEAAYAKTEREVRRTTDAVNAQKFTLGQIGNDLGRLGLGVDHLASAEARLRSSMEQTAAAAGRVASAEERALRRRETAMRGLAEAGKAAAGYGAMMVGGGVVHATEKAVENAADFEAMKNKVYNASGRNEAEVKSAEALATSVAAKNPIVSRTRALEDYMELRSLAAQHDGGIDEAVLAKNVQMMGKARTAAAAIGVRLDDSDARNLAMAIEGSGRAGDPHASERMIDAYLRAKQIYGTAIDASKIRDFVANAKSANFPMNDEAFYYTTFARLAQGNASRLGNEFAQTMSTLVGGRMTKQGAEWLASAGLIRPEQIKKGGGGKFYIDGDIKGKDLLSSDQTTWAQTVLLPGLEKRGVITEDKVAARMETIRKAELKANPNAHLDDHVIRERALHGLISDDLQKSGFRSTVTDNIIHAIANEILIAKDVAQMKKATGLEAADTIGRNPVAAFQELTTAIANLGAVAASPLMANVASVLDSIAKGIGSFSEQVAAFQKEHPELAKWAAGLGIVGGAGAGGALAIGGGAAIFEALSSGFGLKGSAYALTGSAEALTAAAGRLGAAAVAEGAAAGGIGAGGAAAGGAALGWGARLRGGIGLLMRGGGWLAAGAGLSAALWYLGHKAGYDRKETQVDNSEADLRAKGKGWSPALQQTIADHFSPGGMKQLEMQTDHGFHGGGYKAFDPGPLVSSGQDAGSQAGAAIASGVQSQQGAVESAAQGIMDRLRAIFATGVDVPIRLQQPSGQTLRGVHSDAGIDMSGP